MSDRQFRDKEAMQNPEGLRTLWINPIIKYCTHPGCHFADDDQDVIDAHFERYHAQVGLDGIPLTEEDIRMAMIGRSPNDPVRCPFCFCSQRLRATRFFTDEGVLSKKVRCFECRREMLADSMYQSADAYKFGIWVGYYKGFWFKVDHEKWMAALKKTYAKELVEKFWDGYRKVKPKKIEGESETDAWQRRSDEEFKNL